MDITNIDDLLMGIGNSQQPATPEYKNDEQEKNESSAEIESEGEISYGEDESNDKLRADKNTNENDDNEDVIQKKSPDDYEEDDYGNQKERMTQGMKDRLARKDKQFKRELEQRDYELNQLRQQLAQQGASSQVQQAAKEFEYNPNDENSWEHQLRDFVKQTINSMSAEQQQAEMKTQEQTAQQEFGRKFTQGMERFEDFRTVVSAQPIDDAMTLSLRGMEDPAAFIYAASKRNPQELERISKLKDPYARMVEMGKLEERMRRNKPSTNAPRPLGRPREDATGKVAEKQKDTSGDDLLANADKRRLQSVKTRHKANR